MIDSVRPGLTLEAPPVEPHDGCTDDDCQVCMRLTIPQHVDNHGSKLEDLAGAGDYEVLGG
jgi:hypothetical protein